MKVGFEDTPQTIRSSDRWRYAADEDGQAMAIACVVIETYGDLSPSEWEQFRNDGKIWRDHPAYQAALAALRLSRGEP
jgi:hypothetical protein